MFHEETRRFPSPTFFLFCSCRGSYCFGMRCLLFLVMMLSLVSCESLQKKKKEKEKEPPVPTIKDQSKDTAFQSFLGRLRTAVAKRDAEMIASMMVADFGYKWETPGPDENVFQYWDENNLWGELALVVNDRWVPHESFMVAPAQFAMDPAGYSGYRAGVRQVQGSWKFVYFVPGEVPVQ